MDKEKNTYGIAFGKRLQEARLSRNLKQYELAEKAGLTQAVIARLERGGVDNPGSRTLTKLYSALNLSFSEIRNLTRDIAFEDETRVRKIVDSPEYDRYGKENEKLSYDIKMSIPEEWFLSKNVSKELIDYLLPKLSDSELNKVAALAYSMYTVRLQGYLKPQEDLNRIIRKTDSIIDKEDQNYVRDVAVLVYSRSERLAEDEYEEPEIVINKGNEILEKVLGKYIKTYDISSYNYNKSIIYGGLEPERLLKEIKELVSKENELCINSIKDRLDGEIRNDNYRHTSDYENIKLLCSTEEYPYDEENYDDIKELDTRWLYKFNEFDLYKYDSIFNKYALVKYKVVYKR